MLTGGGTGGHAYPAISIGEAVRDRFPDCELLYLGSKNSLESRLANEAGIPFVGLTSRKLGKLLSPGTVLTAGALAKGFVEAWQVLRTFRPDVVIGTGGYAAAAVLLAQVIRRGRIIIHEQNTVPGRTNLWLGRFATRVCLTFEDSAKYFPADRTAVTGLPVRSGLLNLPEKERARDQLDLDPKLFTILVLGGSQGARRLNEVIADSIPALSRLPVQVLHQVGERNYEEAENRRTSIGSERYHVRAYLDDMRTAYAAADLVIGRCGASTIAEITVLGLPAILVPYPYAYADHQRLNGEFMARSGAAVLIDESEFDAERLVDVIERLVDSPAELKRMADSSRALGRPDAAEKIAEFVENLIGKT